MLKRLFDITASTAGLLFLAPLLAIAAVLGKLSSSSPVFFRQDRVGRDFQESRVYEFRSMLVDAPQKGAAITIDQDPRITRVGRIRRAMKIDELPQLISVVVGEMSSVGPRLEVPKYVAMFRDDYQEILQVRPGITDMASILYPDEAAVLPRAPASGVCHCPPHGACRGIRGCWRASSKSCSESVPRSASCRFVAAILANSVL